MDKNKSYGTNTNYISNDTNLNPRRSLLPYGIDNSVEVERIKEIQINQKFDYLFRVSMIGDAGVGKTSLLMRYCDNAFKKLYASTIGVDFRIIQVKYNNYFIKLNIWDTAGQERFKSITSNYFKKAHGFYFVYDVGCKTSFQNLADWVERSKAANNHTCINFLVGNKSDIPDKERQVRFSDGLNFAKMNGMGFFETSAKENINVENSFSLITKQLVEYFSHNKSIYDEIDLGSKLVKQEEEGEYCDVNSKTEPDKGKKCKC